MDNFLNKVVVVLFLFLSLSSGQVVGAAPLEPVALTPEAGAVFSTRPDTFSWQEVSGADSYDLFVYDRTSLSVVHRNSNIGNEICISGVCTYTIDTYDLTYSANHVWRVRSVNV